MSDNNVVRLRPTLLTETPEERGERLMEIVVLPDGRSKRYGDLNFLELQSLVAAERAEMSAQKAEVDAACAEIARQALAGNPEAVACLADPCTVEAKALRDSPDETPVAAGQEASMDLANLATLVVKWRDEGQSATDIERKLRTIDLEGPDGDDAPLIVTQIATERLFRNTAPFTAPPSHPDFRDVIWHYLQAEAEDRFALVHAWIYVPSEKWLNAAEEERYLDGIDEGAEYIAPEKLVLDPVRFGRALAWRRVEVTQAEDLIDELLYLWYKRDDPEFLQHLAEAEAETMIAPERFTRVSS